MVDKEFLIPYLLQILKYQEKLFLTDIIYYKPYNEFLYVILNEVLLCGNPNSIIIYFHQLLEIAILV